MLKSLFRNYHEKAIDTYIRSLRGLAEEGWEKVGFYKGIFIQILTFDDFFDFFGHSPR